MKKNANEKTIDDVSRQLYRLIEEKMLDFNVSYEEAMSLVFQDPKNKTIIQKFVNSNFN